MVSVVATAPTRIDLAGGTIDLWPIHHLLEQKMTINLAIDLVAQSEIRILPPGSGFSIESLDQGLSMGGSFDEITSSRSPLPLISLALQTIWRADWPAVSVKTGAGSPAGAGLGGSSTLAITLVAALWKLRQRLTKEPDLEEEELVRICQDMEAKLIFAPTGCQDYWAAVRGGLNGIAFRFGGTEITTFRDEHAKFFDRHLIVCYSGSSRQSAINNWEIYRQIFDGDKNLLERFAEIGKLSVACWNSIQHFEFAQALELSHREWRLRCDLWPNIETPTTQKIAEVASASGAYFSRVCGAGGGGVMAIFADPENHSYIAHAVTGVGGKVLKANAQTLGLQVCENDNE